MSGRKILYGVICLVIFAIAENHFNFALANIQPPTPTKHFYGDANGDTGISGSDIVQHNNYILSKAYAYDTLQPNNSTQSWNTCDIDSNRGCTGADTVVMNSYLLSKSVSITDDPWSVNNINLPLTGNATGVLIPFNIDLHSTHATQGLSGRPGVSVVVQIDPTSPGTGELSGRSCNPVAGSRNQSAAAGAQCALAVTQTNWPLSASTGPTESGTYGLQVMGYGNGDLNLKIYTTAIPGLDIPATSLRLIVSFGPAGPTADINCSNPGPNPVVEGQLIQCTVTANSGTPIINTAFDTCGGTLNAGIYSFTPGEGGARTCMAAVINGTATHSDTVTIIADSVSLTCPSSVNEDASFSCSITSVGASACSVGPATTCTGATITDCAQIDIAAQGESAGPGSCVVQVTKGESAATKVIGINEVYQNPSIIVDCPSNVPETQATTCNIIVSDGDIPAQTFTCTKNSSTTCQGVTLTGCTQANLVAQNEYRGPGSCIVVVNVSENFTPFGTSQGSDTLVIDEVNQSPYWGSVPTIIRAVFNHPYDELNGAGSDRDVPYSDLSSPGYVMCTKSAQTCSINISVSGSGPGYVRCNIIMNTPTIAEECSVDIRLTDGWGAFITTTVPVSIGEPRIIHVDSDASGTGDGLTWENAITDIHQGISTTGQFDTIWVAEGIYPLNGYTLVLKDNVNMYGGFIGNETSLSERQNPFDHPTIIDGEDNLVTVVEGASHATLDGFQLTGSVNLHMPFICNYSNPIGGGMNNYNIEDLTVTNCLIYDNFGCGGGGGMSNLNVTDLYVSDTIFDSNYAGYTSVMWWDYCDQYGCWGGGMYYFDVYADGGAIYNDIASPQIENCVFTNNGVSNYVSIVENHSSSPTIVNSTFFGNLSYETIFNSSGSLTTVINSILWNSSGYEITGDAVVSYSDVKGGFFGTGNIDIDPLFVGYPDLHLQSSSPCINVGTSTGAPAFDLDGNPRPSPVGGAFDMGAYEYQWP